MTRTLRQSWPTLARWLSMPIVILLAFVISIASFVVALEANSHATAVANARALDAQRQNAALADTFCQVFAPIRFAGQLPVQPGQPPRTTLGDAILSGSTHAANRLQCPPYDPEGKS